MSCCRFDGNTPLGALTLSDIVKTIFFIAIGFVLIRALF
jgi:hypothetical protein